MVTQRQHIPPVIPAILWLGWMFWQSAWLPFETDWIAAMLVFAVLSLVPYALRAETDSPAPRLLLGTGILLALGMGLPQGWQAGVLSLPWLMVISLWTFNRVFPLPKSPALLLKSAGYTFWLVGAAWATADRFGWHPLDFSDVIVRLTAVHFHFAGLLLPLACKRVLPSLAPLNQKGLVWLIIAGIPLVATAITLTHMERALWLEPIAAVIMAAGGGITGILFLRNRAFSLFTRLGGLFLIAGMVLAICYGWRAYLNFSWINIPFMHAVHGSLNALGLGLMGMRFPNS